ncbi:MAG TPA: hypothetical protein VJZ06_02900 [Mobilitalea sp.]|nr:hypothetical protein [Mobilitalea sp.]
MMGIIKRSTIPIILLLCIIMILCIRSNKNYQRNEGTDIFAHNTEIEVILEDASSGKLEKSEIQLTQDESEELINLLGSYKDVLSDNVLKEEFLIWYTVKINDQTTLQINALYDYTADKNITYMYVIQKHSDAVGTYIDATIAEFLAEKFGE